MEKYNELPTTDQLNELIKLYNIKGTERKYIQMIIDFINDYKCQEGIIVEMSQDDFKQFQLNYSKNRELLKEIEKLNNNSIVKFLKKCTLLD